MVPASRQPHPKRSSKHPIQNPNRRKSRQKRRLNVLSNAACRHVRSGGGCVARRGRTGTRRAPAEADRLETQPDLGLPPPSEPDSRRSEEARRRMARIKVNRPRR